ncbi:unnamed protein product [Adineta ricciae]|uniref:Uncharacterized protein n=2 Tax=Adineta ricciae TaxID=249248 RepID=A0A816G1R6_ADIRI|nr:unnamed protein product [Adineta ricciae]
MYTLDFRATAAQRFLAFKSFCRLINNTISNGLVQFYQKQYFAVSTVPLEILYSEIQSTINQFKTSTTNNFLFNLQKIRHTTNINSLLSVHQTNYRISYNLKDEKMLFYTRIYDNCSCDESTACVMAAFIYDYDTDEKIFLVPGMYVGCYIIDALLQSNLQCFYNETCFNQIKSYYNSNRSIQIKPLDATIPSIYFQNSSIQEIINQLMIEQWNSTIFFEKYYNQCQPIGCTYNYQSRNDVIFIITTLVGLVGGIVTVLLFSVPKIVEFIRKRKNGKKQTKRGRIIKKMTEKLISISSKLIAPDVEKCNSFYEN